MALPNPKKEARCNFPIAKVKEAVKQLPNHTKVAVLSFESDPMNVYKFTCKGNGVFNLGMFLDVALHEVGENHTLVQLECRRLVGAIDTANELHECTEFMLGTFSLLGKVITGEAK